MRIDPSAQAGTQHGSSGFYAIADRVVMRNATDDSRTLSLFAEAGVADQDVNRFERFLGLGLVCVGPFAGRGEDELGVAVAKFPSG